MKNLSLNILFFLFANSIFAQITFQEGYFINNQNTKIECLIKNSDWALSPSEFDYKLNANATVETAQISNVKSFQIYNTSHYYKRFDVQLDENAHSNEINSSREMSYQSERHFLKVLVEGKASLYELIQRGTLFFYQLDVETPVQLAYRKYQRQDNKIAEDNNFRKQLFDALQCESMTFGDFVSLEYEQKDLVPIFKSYNECQKSDYKTFLSSETKGNINLKLQAGFTSGSPKIATRRGSLTEETSFDSQVNPTFGFELEFVLPFNQNKWSLYVAPRYQTYKESKQEVSDLFGGFNGEFTLAYNYIDLPFGVRHYFYLNEDSKIFINASYGLVFLSNKDEILKFSRTDNSSNEAIFDAGFGETSSSLNFGLGFNYQENYSVELSMALSKKASHFFYENNMGGSITLMLGYTLF